MKPIVVQVIQHLKPGGIEALVMEILQQSNAVSYHIIALEGLVEDAVKQFPKLLAHVDKIHCLDKPDGFHWQTIRDLAKTLRAINPVACVSHHIGPLLYLSLANIPIGIKHIHTEHDAWHLDNSHHHRIQKWCLRLSKPLVVADASFVQKKLIEHFPNINSKRIYNGIDTNRFRPGNCKSARFELGLPQNVKLIGCAARLEQVKRIDRLIDALHNLPEHIHLAIAGLGSQEAALKQQCKQMGLSDRVHFVGYMQDASRFFHCLDVFCLVSENEGFPLSTLEAQACGVPVISSNVGGASETLCPKTGLLLISDDHNQLLNAIKLQLNRNLLDSPRQYIESHFSLAQMVAAYEGLFFQSTQKAKL